MFEELDLKIDDAAQASTFTAATYIAKLGCNYTNPVECYSGNAICGNGNTTNCTR